MNLADKIITLRKKQGWSQEELADKLDVSRQSVSKWEGAQSVPDLNKIILLSQIFGVSTDYLLKDADDPTPAPIPVDETKKRLVTKSDATKFLALRKTAAKRIAAATCACILSPIVMFLLVGGTYMNWFPLTEDAAGSIGMAILLLVVACACAVFIHTGIRNTPFEFIEKEEFDTEYGVADLARNVQKEFLPTYSKYNVIGVVLCILSVIPLMVAGMFADGELPLTLCVTLGMIAAGVTPLIYAGVIHASTQKLLQEGDFTPMNKKINEKIEVAAGIYWLVTTAVFLAWGWLSQDWKISGIIWPVAGVLFAAFSIAVRQYLKKKYE